MLSIGLCYQFLCIPNCICPFLCIFLCFLMTFIFQFPPNSNARIPSSRIHFCRNGRRLNSKLSLFEAEGSKERCKETTRTCRTSKYLKVNIKLKEKTKSYWFNSKLLLFEAKSSEERCKETSRTCRTSKYLKVNIKLKENVKVIEGIQNCWYLRPRAPKRDVKKLLEHAGQVKQYLRLIASKQNMLNR